MAITSLSASPIRPGRIIARICKAAGVSYLVCGKRDVDLRVALQKLHEKFGLKKLMLEGGGKFNGSMLQHGLVDEISQVIVPVADGGEGISTMFDAGDPVPKSSMAHLRFKSVKKMAGDVHWFRYQGDRQFGSQNEKAGFAMKYIRLGETGLKVSRICLGCMSYGVPERGPHLWSIPEDQARPFIKQAIEAGINFFDTANVYSDGTSEEIVGKLLKEFVPRDQIVLATKVHGRMRPDANGAGLSRKAIMTEIDHSLRRLGMDYVDLYQIHRWDYTVPIEETLEALHDVVKAGKVRYIKRRQHACVAILPGALPGRPARLDAVCLDAESLQPDLPRRRARDDEALFRPGHQA